MMHLSKIGWSFAVAAIALVGVALAASSSNQKFGDMRNSLELAAEGHIYNPEAPVPPQCYTRIEGRHNPCYICHQNNKDSTRPNFMQDGSLQQAYEFSEAGLTNHHINLFIDRSEAVAEVSDAEILAYINEDNFSDLSARLESDGWTGWLPDLQNYALGAEAFDDWGMAKDGSGWVAFNYKPLPSTFWPTNGSTDDVLIRLPDSFRRDADGIQSRDVYMANLALTEIAFQDLDQVSLPRVNEVAIGEDIDGDGAIATADFIIRRNTYLGKASDVGVWRMSYPQGTDFLHSVRYVGVDGERIVTPKRMKELRYMSKSRRLTVAQIDSRYGNEIQEKVDENLPRYIDLGDRGFDTGQGWTMVGFIEDAEGNLRPQTNEENFFCRGCHSSVGANLDQTWAFPRKLRGADGWGYINLIGMQDATTIGDNLGEIATYFSRVGGGDEFRSNPEMLDRFFLPDGSVNMAAIEGCDVYDLITPSPARALRLNKAYRTIVKAQTFIYGRDATITPPANVHAQINEANAATLPRELRFKYDIRLNWD